MPRCSLLSASSANHRSTWLSQEEWVGVQQFVAGENGTSRQEAMQRSIIEDSRSGRRTVLCCGRSLTSGWRYRSCGPCWSQSRSHFGEPSLRNFIVERVSGIAPAGPDSERLVAALLWSSLSCPHIAGLSDVDDDLDEDAVRTRRHWMSC
jgi:hypothetical protein